MDSPFGGLALGFVSPMQTSMLTMKSTTHHFTPRNIDASVSLPNLLSAVGIPAHSYGNGEQCLQGPDSDIIKESTYSEQNPKPDALPAKKWKSVNAVDELPQDFVPSDSQLQKVQQKRDKQWWRKIRPVPSPEDGEGQDKMASTKGRARMPGKHWKKASLLSKKLSMDIQEGAKVAHSGYVFRIMFVKVFI